VAGSKLPVIPDMSGAAVQQTGGTLPLPSPLKEPPTVIPDSGFTPPPSGGLPVIPGVSGKAQNGTPPPASKQETPPSPPRIQVDFKNNP
jgi:hypothetical protein